MAARDPHDLKMRSHGGGVAESELASGDEGGGAHRRRLWQGCLQGPEAVGGSDQ